MMQSMNDNIIYSKHTKNYNYIQWKIDKIGWF